jgi:hypothetical protein
MTPKPPTKPQIYALEQARDGGLCEAMFVEITAEEVERRSADSRCRDRKGAVPAKALRDRLIHAQGVFVAVNSRRDWHGAVVVPIGLVPIKSTTVQACVARHWLVRSNGDGKATPRTRYLLTSSGELVLRWEEVAHG